jgi:phosphoserine phosphatase
MASVIFDFDSTLIRVESLEEILRPQLESHPQRAAEMEEITKRGMEGQIGFRESLELRLKIAQPTRQAVEDFGHRAKDFLTPGLDDVIAMLQERGVEVRIVSGGLRESIVPLAQQLGIAADHVHAVRLKWHDDGAFAGIDPQDPFSDTKRAGFTELRPELASPCIIVGDGYTDFVLFECGLADHFVAFTAHQRREAVVSHGCPEANDKQSLIQHLESFL